MRKRTSGLDLTILLEIDQPLRGVIKRRTLSRTFSQANGLEAIQKTKLRRQQSNCCRRSGFKALRVERSVGSRQRLNTAMPSAFDFEPRFERLERHSVCIEALARLATLCNDGVAGLRLYCTPPDCHCLIASIGQASIKMFSSKLSRIQNVLISSRPTNMPIAIRHVVMRAIQTPPRHIK